MKNKMKNKIKTSLFLVCCALFFNVVDAQENVMPNPNQIMKEAEQQWEKAQKECMDKILVNACLDWAQKEFRKQYNAGKMLKQQQDKEELNKRQRKAQEKAKKQAEKIKKHQEKLAEKLKNRTKK